MKKFQSDIQFKNLSEAETMDLVPKDLIHLGFRGSIAHGTYVPNNDPNSIDDKDILGIYIAPIEYYFGLQENKGVHERFIKEWDAVSYELKKFIRLLLKGNPNVLGVLWLPKKHIIFESQAGKRLREARSLFVSKQVYHSFNGYAYGQFKRMTHFKFEGYMGEKRKALVNKYGFDAKNASHLIRLLRMGIEFLTDGELYVERPDSENLIAIKHGEWSFEKVKEEAERLFKLAEETYTRSNLPKNPDFDAAEKLCVDIISEHFKK